MEPATDFAKNAFEQVTNKNWIGLAAVILIALVWAAKKTPLISWVPWFKTTWGGWTLTMTLSFLASVGHSLQSTGTYSWKESLVAIEVAFLAAGGWEFVKDKFGKKDTAVLIVNETKPTEDA